VSCCRRCCLFYAVIFLILSAIFTWEIIVKMFCVFYVSYVCGIPMEPVKEMFSMADVTFKFCAVSL